MDRANAGDGGGAHPSALEHESMLELLCYPVPPERPAVARRRGRPKAAGPPELALAA